MKKILKKFSLVIILLINLSILFNQTVFADMAVPSEYSSVDDIMVYIKIAIVLAIIIGIIFIFIVKKNQNKKDEEKDSTNYNKDDEETMNLINNLTNNNKDTRND